MLLIIVQVLDLPLCADEAREAQHDHTAAELADISSPGPSKHQVPDHGPDSDGDPVLPDCLCHVIFVSTAYVPEMNVFFSSLPFAAFRHAEAPSAPPSLVEHIPIA